MIGKGVAMRIPRPVRLVALVTAFVGACSVILTIALAVGVIAALAFIAWIGI